MSPRKILKVGNSYAVTIPREMLSYLEIRADDYVVLTAMEPNTIIVQKLEHKKPKGLFVRGTGHIESKDEK